MRTMNKLFLIATLVLGLGFVACNDANDVSPVDESKANTHVSVTLKLGTNSSQKASANGMQKVLPNDYNYLGEWAGKDKIEKITVYLVDAATVTSKTFNVGAGLDYEVATVGSDLLLLPKLETAAIKTTAGQKTVYVLINGTAAVIAHLNKTPVAEFEDSYQRIAFVPGNTANSVAPVTAASKLAVKNGVADETIVMTNVQPATLTLLANITATQTIGAAVGNAALNRLSLDVERAVARVMVTTKQATYNVPDPNSNGASNLGAISNITWVVAQGENSLYVQRKAAWETPNYLWVPGVGADVYSTQAAGKYDYSGLFENYGTGFGGTTIPTMAGYAAASALVDISADLDAQLSGKFLLPNTHAAGVKAASSYKKGNTAYVLVRAQFTPEAGAYADGGTYTVGDDFFVGANGKFYTTASNAVTVAKGGVVGQAVAKYVKGKVLYYAWINPDEVPDWYNSPVLRNNIYHIHITGFKNLGTNWNPLFPGDPTIPGDPTTGGNPDPKPTPDPLDPNYPDEPGNPIDPNDPLTTSETWMSVDVKVLPWKLHSYSVDLGM